MRSVVIGGLVLAAGAAMAQGPVRLPHGSEADAVPPHRVDVERAQPVFVVAQADERPTAAEPPPPPGIDDAGADEGPVTLEEAVPGAGEKVLPAAREGAADDDGLQPRTDATAGLPEKVRAPGDDGTAVTIRTEGDTTIEEYRRAGAIYMIRVQPAQGVAYTYLDTDGDGRLEGDPDDAIEGPARPVYYTLYEWE